MEKSNKQKYKKEIKSNIESTSQEFGTVVKKFVNNLFKISEEILNDIITKVFNLKNEKDK